MAAPDARRLEELGLNSSAPPGQLLYDGWLLRLAPGKAKRARSVNAVYASTLPLDTKIAYCERLYGAARVPMLFRMTPFSQPSSLDAELARRGFERFEDTVVEAAPIDPRRCNGEGARPMNLAAWVDAVGELRASPTQHRIAQRARLEGIPLTLRAVAVEDAGIVVATGLTIVEGDCAGLFDVITREDSRMRGHARTIVSTLLRTAWELGARHAYLQVKADNAAARRLYAQFGFSERYQYWYRGRPGEME
jgi:GNAT superfamily N-acetyltransferase